MIITLLGYMGSGKSTIGQQLASVLGYDFVDLDAFIEVKEGRSISEIFKSKGEIYFRKAEHNYLKELLVQDKNIVLSLGGGTPCYANNMELLNTVGVVSCYLKLTPSNLAIRLFNEKSQRPIISHIETEEVLREFIAIHLFERQRYYQLATYVLDINALPPKAVIELIVKRLY